MSAELPRVLVLHNAPREPHGEDRSCIESDAGVLVEVQALVEALKELGAAHRVVGVAQLEDLPPVLTRFREPVVFNLVEGFHRHPEEACSVPAVCAAFGKVSTGSPASCLDLTLDKARTKAVLQAAGLPVPAGVLVQPGQVLSRDALPSAPWIVKPVQGDASEGIRADDSIFTQPGPALDRAVLDIHERFGQPALIEQFVGVREINVSVLQHGRHLEMLPIGEIDFSAFGPDRPRVVDYAAKWHVDSWSFRNTPRIIPATLSESLADRIRGIARAAWEAVGCLDYARVDFRLDAYDRPIVLEVNPNPDISPDAGWVAALTATGISFGEFVRIVLTNAAGRQRPGVQKPRPAAAAAKAKPPQIDPTRPADRQDILKLLETTGFFLPVETEVAREVLDEAIAKGLEGHYQSFTARLDGTVVGWACFGATPVTSGTFDVYWLAVDPRQQGRGLGRYLMQHVEQLISERGGRLVIVETAGRPLYQPTHQFYQKVGYTEEARVHDFYGPGDDKIIYVKYLGA